jgi:hypothetical protein
LEEPPALIEASLRPRKRPRVGAETARLAKEALAGAELVCRAAADAPNWQRRGCARVDCQRREALSRGALRTVHKTSAIRPVAADNVEPVVLVAAPAWIPIGALAVRAV